MKISVVIPCYNHHKQVIQAVPTVLGQTWDDLEVIVVDDGSNPPLKHSWSDKRVRLITHETNKGLSSALNTGLKASTGDYFSILASDDGYMPDFIKELGAAALEHPDVDVISCDMLTPRGVVYCKPGNLTQLKTGNCHSYAALTKRWVWEKSGGYNLHMNPSWEDWEFWLHAAKLGAKWYHVAKPLHWYNRAKNGRDVESQGKDSLLQGKMQGFHPDLFGSGKGEVAFIIPCYKQEEWVKNAVNSVFAQTYPHVRAIVVDDGSPGDVRKALGKYPNPKLTLLRQPNKHLSGARNAGIKLAVDHYNSEYIVPLDADDTVHPDFIEALMPYCDGRTYAYCDVQFIGAAWHTFQVDDYDCMRLIRKHLHACSILMHSHMWKALVKRRGYGYDESMKEGYEDWEFALALLKTGYCGHRVPKYLFNYRQHESGSMRQATTDKNAKLYNQIRQRQPWIRDIKEVAMACSTCGKSRYGVIINSKSTGGQIAMYNVPGVGAVDGREPILVTYAGSMENTQTKLGANGRVYKYTNKPEGVGVTHPNQFTIFACDVHLFQGAYTFQRLEGIKPAQVEVPEPVVVNVVPAMTPSNPSNDNPPLDSTGQRLLAKAMTQPVVEEYPPDDFTQLKYVGDSTADKFKGHGFYYFEDVAEASVEEIKQVAGVSEAKAREIINSAQELLELLAETDK